MTYDCVDQLSSGLISDTEREITRKQSAFGLPRKLRHANSNRDRSVTHGRPGTESDPSHQTSSENLSHAIPATTSVPTPESEPTFLRRFDDHLLLGFRHLGFIVPVSLLGRVRTLRLGVCGVLVWDRVTAV